MRDEAAAPESSRRTLPTVAPGRISARMLSRSEDSAASAASSVSAVTSAPPFALSNSVKPVSGPSASFRAGRAMANGADAVLGLPSASVATPAGTVTVTVPLAPVSGTMATMCSVPSVRLAIPVARPLATARSDIAKPVTGSLNRTVTWNSPETGASAALVTAADGAASSPAATVKVTLVAGPGVPPSSGSGYGVAVTV